MFFNYLENDQQLWHQVEASWWQTAGFKPAASSDSIIFSTYLCRSRRVTRTRHVVARRTHCFEVRMTNPDTRFFLGGCEDVREHLNQLLLFHFCAFPACVTLSLAAYRTPKRGDAPSSQKTASTGFPLSTTRRAERSRIAPHVRRVRCPRRQGFPASPAERYSVRKPL